MAADGRRPEGVSADIAMNGWVVRQVIRAAGEILLTAGVVGLLYLGYLVWGTGLRAASAQRALSGELSQEWRQGLVRGDAVGASPERFDVATGQPFAFIRIPAFGKQWRYTLIQGTVIGKQWVAPTDTAVLDPVPGHPQQ